MIICQRTSVVYMKYSSPLPSHVYGLWEFPLYNGPNLCPLTICATKLPRVVPVIDLCPLQAILAISNLLAYNYVNSTCHYA